MATKANGKAKTTTKFVASMKPIRARFAVNGSTLVITARHGARGYSVQASMRANAKAKAQSGARSLLQGEARTRAEFDRLKTEALGKGWIEQVVAGGNAFADIPAPPSKRAA